MIHQIQSSSFDVVSHFQVETAKEEIICAEEYQTKARKKKIILVVIAGVVLAVLIIALVTLS